MRGMKHLSVRVALVVLIILGLVLFVAACGGSTTTTTAPAPVTTTSMSTTTTAASTTTSGAGSSTTSGGSSDAVAAITANWVKFFDGTSSAADKVALLENGQQFASAIEAQAGSPLAKSVSAVVSSVTVDSATTATVKYSLALGGTVALPDQTGQAVLQDGVWKVSDQSFQALLALEGATTPSTS
jgi:hypothetical protein